MPPLWFMPVLFQMSSCLLRANYFIVHERWKPAWDTDELWCKESRNFIKSSNSCLLPMEETLLPHLSGTKQWMLIETTVPWIYGIPPRPLIWPTKPLYYWWILPITDVIPVSRQGPGVLSSVCTCTVLGSSGTVVGGIFPKCSDHKHSCW